MKHSRSIRTHHDDRCVRVRPEVARLEYVAEVRRACCQYEAMRSHVSPARRGQEYVGERLGVEQRRHRAVQVGSIAVPLELEVLRRWDADFFRDDI